MPIPKEYRDICEMLKKATDEGRINWVEKSGTFAVYLPQFSFEIWSGSDEEDRLFVAVGIRDPAERYLVDSFNLQEGGEDFWQLYELFQGARRHARQVNQKLEALRGLLRTDQKVGYAAEEILIILSAQYGAKEHTVDVAEVLSSKIISGSIKNFRVNNENLGKDPIPGVPKTLKVDYLYCGKNHSISIQEGKLLTIPSIAD